jgi:hypothetical protein
MIFLLSNSSSGGGGGAISSVSNSDSTLTVSPTTGAVVASINLANANAWTAAQSIASNSANAFAVGANGSTNPVLKVDASVASQVTGISIQGKAAAAGVEISVISSGTDEALTINAKGAGTVTIAGTSTGTVTIGNGSLAGILLVGTTTLNGQTIVSAAVSNVFVVGANGSTNPVLQVDTSVASVATGISIQGQAAGGGVNMSVISSGSNESLTIAAKGTGSLIFNAGQSGGAGTITMSTAGGFGPASVLNFNFTDANHQLQINNGSQAVLTMFDGLNLTTSSNNTINLSPNGSGGVNITSAAAGALRVGPNSNYSFYVDSSAGSAATGLRINAKAAASGLAMVVISSGTNENLTIDAKGSGTVTINGTATGIVILPSGTTIGGSTVLTSTVTSSSATAFQVGQNGATNPAFVIDASTASSATGIKIKSAAAAAGVAISVISSGTNENLTIDAKGSGNITLGGTSTGSVVISPTGSNNLNIFGSSSGNPNVSIGGANFLGGLFLRTKCANALLVVSAGSNSVFNVDTSATSAATGINITSAAAAAGIAIAAISTGTNENMTIDAKGSGTIALNGTATGIVIANRGARKSMVIGQTLTALGSVQNTTPTAAQLIGGIISHTSVTGAGTATLDTGTNISSAVPGVAVGDTFTCTYANIGTQTVTITTNTGLTLVGTAAIPTLKNALLTFYNTGANTWNVYINVSA